MPMAIVAVLILVVVGKGLFKFAFVLLFGHPLRVALTVSAGLAQVGEFSFILGTVGLSLGLLPVEGFQLIVAGALLSIALNPLLFRLADWLEPRLRDNPAMHRSSRTRPASWPTSSLQRAARAARSGSTRSCAATGRSGG